MGPWGQEDADTWWVVHGDREWIVEERPEFMAVPGGIALVSKRTGLLTLTTYVEDRERLDAMTPVGEAESTSE